MSHQFNKEMSIKIMMIIAAKIKFLSIDIGERDLICLEFEKKKKQ